MRMKSRLGGCAIAGVALVFFELAGCTPDFGALKSGSGGTSGDRGGAAGRRADSVGGVSGVGGVAALGGRLGQAGSGGGRTFGGAAGQDAMGGGGDGGAIAELPIQLAGAGGTPDEGFSGASAGGSAGQALTDNAGGVPGDPVASPIEVVEELPIAKTWSGHPVDYALLTHQGNQFVAFYNGSQNMMVASRRLSDRTWTTQALPSTASWDSHQGIRLAVDADGHLHLVGNMHNSALVYFRTTEPLDISTFKRQFSMIGTEESSCTYPELFHGPDDALVFAYRNGASGGADHIFNLYDENTQTWSRLLTTPLLSGEGVRNAYPVGPIQGPDGYWHIVWVWRDTANAETNHDLSYARSRDLLNWERADGTPLELPITLSTGDIVDPVQSGGGMINNNTRVGFDADARPIVSYHKFDENGVTQLYNARFEAGTWVTRAATNWDYTWNFGGGGTIVFEILVEPVVTAPNGELIQRYFHKRYGGWGAFLLNAETLGVVEEVAPPLPYPKGLDTPTTAQMGVRWAKDSGTASNSDVYYMLRWETLDSNRDVPRAEVPAPTDLRLYGFRSKAEQ